MTKRGETKLIIITSDEDLIRRLSSNRNVQSEIIDLDENLNVPTNSFNDHFLSQLSQLNPKPNEKTEENLFSTNPMKTKKTAKKCSNEKCFICEDFAIGYNYDVLSCASCKAFFRRNAHQNLTLNRCLKGDGKCPIKHWIEKKCQFCRLQKCFQCGMRKDFLLTDEEKSRRKKRPKIEQIPTNQSTSQEISLRHEEQIFPPIDFDIDQFLSEMEKDLTENGNLMEMNLFNNENVSIDEYLTIENLRFIFLSTFARGNEHCFHLDVSDRNSALLSWSQSVNQMGSSLIEYFRQIQHFEHFNINDREILIQSKFFQIIPLLKSFYSFQREQNEHLSLNSSTQDACEKQQTFFRLFGHTNDIREDLLRLIKSLNDITQKDPTIISLLMIICLFSEQNLSESSKDLICNSCLNVYHAQSYYLQLLWNYLVEKEGEYQTSKHFIKIVSSLFQIQSVTTRHLHFIRRQFSSFNSFHQLTPLMQNILKIY